MPRENVVRVLLNEQEDMLVKYAAERARRRTADWARTTMLQAATKHVKRTILITSEPDAMMDMFAAMGYDIRSGTGEALLGNSAVVIVHPSANRDRLLSLPNIVGVFQMEIRSSHAKEAYELHRALAPMVDR